MDAARMSENERFHERDTYISHFRKRFYTLICFIETDLSGDRNN